MKRRRHALRCGPAPKPLPPCPKCQGELARTPTRLDPDLLTCGACGWTLPQSDPLPCPECNGERIVFTDPADPLHVPELVCIDCTAFMPTDEFDAEGGEW